MFLKAIFFGAWIALSSFAAVTQYNWPATEPKSDKYTVKIRESGSSATYALATTHYSVPTLLAGPDGDGVTGILEDRSMSFIQVARTGAVEVEVTKKWGTAATRVEIAPKTYGIQASYFDGNVVRFSVPDNLPGPAYVSVHFISADNQDDDGNGGKNIKNGLMLFLDAPETNAPSLSGAGVVAYSATANIDNASIIYFAPGEYNLKNRYTDGVLRLKKNGQKVYLAGGAYVRGAIHGEGFDNVGIYGRGIITGKDYFWHEIVDEKGVKDAYLNFMGSDNASFEGVAIVNPCHHTIPSGNKTRHKNIKIIGWASNHDGVRPGSASISEEIFIKTSDDLDYARDQHVMQRSVIWPMRNGAFGQLGWNNLGDGNTRYSNLFFINSEWNTYKRNAGIIGSNLQQGAVLANDTIENIYGENNVGLLANITLEYSAGDPFDATKPGDIHDFIFRNIIFETGFTLPSGVLVKNPLQGFIRNGAVATVRNIKFINLVVGNEVVTSSNYTKYFNIDAATTSNITFTTQGSIYTVATSAGANGKVLPLNQAPVPAGMTRVITIEPNAGYKIQNVIIDGVSQGRIQSYAFSNVNANHTVSATFVPGDDYYAILSSSSSSSVVLSSSSASVSSSSRAIVLSSSSASVSSSSSSVVLSSSSASVSSSSRAIVLSSSSVAVSSSSSSVVLSSSSALPVSVINNLRVSPVLVRNSADIHYSITDRSLLGKTLTFQLFSATGSMVISFVEQNLRLGDNQTWLKDGHQLAAGSYVLKVLIDSKVAATTAFSKAP